jgi:hypothetical protein
MQGDLPDTHFKLISFQFRFFFLLPLSLTYLYFGLRVNPEPISLAISQ